MRRFSGRATALALALVLGASPAALASVALGDDIKSSSVFVGQSTELTTGVFWSNTYSDLRTEHYLTYMPNPVVTPIVCYGDKILSKQTLTSMARPLETDGRRVVGGMNGDYYVVATGAPLGLVITDGVLRSSASYLYGVGFRADGTVFVGQPQLSVTATFSGQTLIVAGINKVRTATDGYYLLTDDFSAGTQNSQPGVDVILSPVLDHVGHTVDVSLKISDSGGGETPAETTELPALEPVSESREVTDGLLTVQQDTADGIADTLIQSAKPTVGGRVTYVVEQVLQSAGSIDIPAGKAVLTVNSKSNEWLVSQLASLRPGDTVDVDITSPDPRWAEAEYAVGGMYKLVTAGAVESGLDAEQAPRSAVGIRADGTAVFYTIDGRQTGHSVGATLSQVAQRLVELGCTEAVCMDGGGSATMGTSYPDASSFGVVNRPSDGYERANSNAVFLVSNLTPTRMLSHLYVTPGDAMLLAGATARLAVSAVDTAWYPMPLSSPVTWSATGGTGTVSSDGVFTAGSVPGVAAVTAAAGGASGSAYVTVIDTPDTILLSDEAAGAAVTSLALEPGQVVDLRATAIYKKLTLTAQDTCFAWTADSGAGTVDQNGLFTAADKTGTGSLTVSAGGRSAVIPVSVTGHVLPLEDFEGELFSFVGTDTADVSLQTGAEQVRYGRQSLKLSYDTAKGGPAAAAAFLAITPGERHLNLWVYGDGSGNTLTATISDSDGVRTDVALAGLDFTGWKYVTAALPANAAGMTALNVFYGGGASASGTLYLDQITTSNEAVYDLTPPAVTVSVSGGMLLAGITDSVTHEFAKEQIRVTRDGSPLEFTWNAADGTAEAALPAHDGKLHRLTVTAADLCGNIGRASYDMEPEATEEPEGEEANLPQPAETEAEAGAPAFQAYAPPFTDMTGHWADKYTTYLYDHAVTTGILTESGLQFQPEKQITRGEFFLMVSRWMGLDLSAYAAVELPFDDLGSIADWALPGVKAMYALGIMKGSRDGDALNANAGSAISRAEAMAVLGRIQPRGYAEPELTFEDSSTVPAWALAYVKSLVGQGVVGGYDNRVHPTNPVRRGEVAKMLYTIL